MTIDDLLDQIKRQRLTSILRVRLDTIGGDAVVCLDADDAVGHALGAWQCKMYRPATRAGIADVSLYVAGWGDGLDHRWETSGPSKGA